MLKSDVFVSDIWRRGMTKTATRVSARPPLSILAVAFLTFVPFAGSFATESQMYATKTYKIKATVIANGLENPWGLAFLPNGDMLVTERPGRLRLIRDGVLQPEPITGTPDVVARGQGGLLDVAVHPGFLENNLVYLTYAGRGEGGANTEVARAVLNGGKLEKPEVIFKVEPKTGGANHYGSRMLFHPDGSLYVTLGDRYTFLQEAQNTKNHLGTILRLTMDGKPAPENPFAGTEGARPEIFSYGHRNVQGIALRPGTDQVWAHEHGPRGGDELNLLKPGANYGWPAITYGIDYSGAIISDKTEAPGMEQPAVFWTPSIAPSGMAFYNGDKFAKWKGDLFVGALAGMHLRRIRLKGDNVIEQEALLGGLGERIRDVRQGPDGFLYIVTDDPADGKVIRLEPADTRGSAAR
jgi:glucose/arabinose dehydrogenase